VTAPATLPTAPVAELDEVSGPTPWLVRSLLSEQAVGFVAGTRKSCKSWFGLDLAISVASNTPCLDRFEVEQPGRSLVYLAEDSLPQVRRRIAGICQHPRLNSKPSTSSSSLPPQLAPRLG
jgi:RecA-family ATPase